MRRSVLRANGHGRLHPGPHDGLLGEDHLRGEAGGLKGSAGGVRDVTNDGEELTILS